MEYFYIVLILFIILYFKYDNTKIIFYSSSDIVNRLYFILNDYYYRMSTENLKLRNIENITDYLINLNTLFYTCNPYEKKIITNAVYKANKKLSNLHFFGFNPNKLKNIPWIFGFSKDSQYEFGMPHTQGDTIILNKNNIYLSDLVTLLIHERIHIYQKLYPDDVDEFLKYYNFEKISKKNNIDRTNPDTNNFIYTRFNEIYECKIIDNNIACTNDNSAYEHPYEFMAYMISEAN